MDLNNANGDTIEPTAPQPHDSNIPSTASPPTTVLVPETPDPNPDQRLQDLTSSLSASTGLINRLRTRGTIQRAELAHQHRQTRADLDTAHAETEIARAATEAARGRQRGAVIKLKAILAVWVVYAVWCWLRAPELGYVRKRVEEWYGLR